MFIQSIQQSNSTLNLIIQNVFQQIHKKQILTHLYQYSYLNSINLISICYYQSNPNNNQTKPIQQQPERICIPKDNYISYQIHQQPFLLTQINFSHKKCQNQNNKQHNVFSPQKQGKQDNNTKKNYCLPNLKLNKKKYETNKINHSINSKRLTYNKELIPIDLPSEQALQQDFLRKIKNDQLERFLKMQNERTKELKQKQKLRDEIISQKKQIVYDTDGSIIKSNLLDIQKLKPVTTLKINIQNTDSRKKKKHQFFHQLPKIDNNNKTKITIINQHLNQLNSIKSIQSIKSLQTIQPTPKSVSINKNQTKLHSNQQNLLSHKVSPLNYRTIKEISDNSIQKLRIKIKNGIKQNRIDIISPSSYGFLNKKKNQMKLKNKNAYIFPESSKEIKNESIDNQVTKRKQLILNNRNKKKDIDIIKKYMSQDIN